MITYSKRFSIYIRSISFVSCKSHKNVLLTPKYVALYSYVNIGFKNLFNIMSFSSCLGIIYEFFQVVKAFIKHWLQCLNNVFENSNFIVFISNFYMCFHNILKALSSKHIKKMYNVNISLETKT